MIGSVQRVDMTVYPAGRWGGPTTCPPRQNWYAGGPYQTAESECVCAAYWSSFRSRIKYQLQASLR